MKKIMFKAIAGLLIALIVMGVGTRLMSEDVYAGIRSDINGIYKLVPIGTDIFPDDVFRTYISENFDTDKDGSLKYSELLSVRKIDLSNVNNVDKIGVGAGTTTYKSLSGQISDLTGLKYFQYLEELDISYNPQIKNIDISSNAQLKTLIANNTGLSNISLINFKVLETLDIWNTDISRVNIINNKSLKIVDIRFTGVKSLYVWNCPNLVSATGSKSATSCYGVACDKYVSGSNSIFCSKSTEIISVKPDGVVIDADTFGSDNFRDYLLEDYDTNADGILSSDEGSKVTKLDASYCYFTEFKGLEYFPNLEDLGLLLTSVKSIDVSKNPKLKVLSLILTPIQSLDVTNNPELETLICYNTNVSSLDLSNNSKLKELNCSNLKIETLDVSNCPELTSLKCKGSNITSINIGNNPYLLEEVSNGSGKYTFDVPADCVVDTSKPTPTPTPAPAQTPTNVPTAAPSTSPVNVDAKKVDGFAERLYTKCMNRQSDPSGKAYWIGQLKSGVSGAYVAKQFFFSPEFIGFGLGDQEYVTRLYRTFMDREPDQPGMEYWLGQLAAGKTREFVFDGFVNSPEWANICLEYGIVSGGNAKPTISKTPSAETVAFATRLYTTCLQRTADAAGVDYWSKELANMRKSGTQVAYEFFFSKELSEQNISDEDFVNRLYATFMGREADQAGFDYWMGQLQSKDRKTVLYQFAGCQEFADICSDAGIMR